MRLHRHMRIQMIQRAIRLLASLPATLVHPFDFFISTARPLVLLRARDGDKRVHLGQRVRALSASAAETTNQTKKKAEPSSRRTKAERIPAGRRAYLARASPGSSSRSRCGHCGSRGVIGPVGHAMWVSCVLLRPMPVAGGGMALIL